MIASHLMMFLFSQSIELKIQFVKSITNSTPTHDVINYSATHPLVFFESVTLVDSFERFYSLNASIFFIIV